MTTARSVRHRVLEVRGLSTTAYVLRFDRRGLAFEPGQYLALGLPGHIDRREYSIYSSESDDGLEVLVKEVPEGLVSRQLRRLDRGAELAVEGPYGFFTIDREMRGRGFTLIATGTGISPHHCFVRSYPELDYTVLHGVRHPDERYDHHVFAPDRYVSCISQHEGGDFRGRVTEYIKEQPQDPERLFYLCGNCDMIYEAFDTLRGQGVPSEHLFAEVYF
jgi:ferredoxin--NADP+ reductase/benzoate/toluate 1,2-dioxygenase reductase subunit